MNGNLNGTNRMREIVEDLFKIYVSAIDSNTGKIIQNINEKYTLIDKSMISTYLYFKILNNLKIENEDSKTVLMNYLVKQVIYGETGNLSLEISDNSRKELYDEIINKLIIEQFEYKNRILKCLKYNYVQMDNNIYCDLLEFCEKIAEYYILDKFVRRGNQEAKELMAQEKNKFKINKKNLKNKIKEICKAKSETENNAEEVEKSKKAIDENIEKIEKEKLNLLNLILKNKFKNTEYYNLIQVSLKLKDVYRYSTLTSVVPEDVLFHQYSMTLVNMTLADYMIKNGENIDKYELVKKCLFHDFSEYKGNEIVAQIKVYSDETKKMFAEIEEKDEQELKDLLGEDLYIIIKEYKKGKEGYIAEIIDKFTGMMKLWVEAGYMNNYTYIKSVCSVYQERFKKFNDTSRIDDFKDKLFLQKLLKEIFIYIKENLVNLDPRILTRYFTSAEIKSFKRELKSLKKKEII